MDNFPILGSRMLAEKNSEKSEFSKQHQREIQDIRKEHKREVDVRPNLMMHKPSLSMYLSLKTTMFNMKGRVTYSF